MILIGSGDREKPLRDWTNAYANTNYFFMFKDNPTDATYLAGESATCGSAVLCLNSLLPILTSANPTDADLATKKGWYIGLIAHEQVVTSAITIFGTVTFSTHVPVPAAAGCVSNLGTARVYNISYKNASSQNGTLNRSRSLRVAACRLHRSREWLRSTMAPPYHSASDATTTRRCKATCRKGRRSVRSPRP